MAIIIDEFRLTPLPRGWVCHACGRDADSQQMILATATCRFPACALWKARRELRRAIRARRKGRDWTPTPPAALPLLLAALLVLAGCAQPPVEHVPHPVEPVSEEEFRRSQEQLRHDLRDEIRRAMQAPPPQLDLSPVLSELKQLRQREQATRYTGCKVFVNSDDLKCIPCARAKRDLFHLARAGKWRVGEDATAHFWLHYEAQPEGPTPRFEFWRDGQVVAVIEDYGSTPRAVDRQDGFEGPIHTLIDACQRYCSPASRSGRRVSTVQSGQYGASTGFGYGSQGGFGYGGSYGSSVTETRVTTSYGSTGGEYGGSFGLSYTPQRVRVRRFGWGW